MSIVILGPSNKFVFPPRLALDIEYPPLVRVHIDHPDTALFDRFSSPALRLDRKLQRFGARRVRIEEKSFCLNVAVGSKVIARDASAGVTVANVERALASA